MDEGRRRFLRATGVALAGLGGGTPLADSALTTARRQFARAPGERVARRWAFVIDTKACARSAGCMACAEACHRIHNVPALGMPKEEIKWIWKESYSHAFPEVSNEYLDAAVLTRPVLVLCNHCDNPACVRVCPTQATWRRPDGIVMMDEHRCIGCRYCIVACPYGARSFNWRDPRPFLAETNPEYPTRRKGVVEKCTLCVERLAEGLPPACVEACQQATGGAALACGDVADPTSEIARVIASGRTIRRKPTLGTRPQVFYLV